MEVNHSPFSNFSSFFNALFAKEPEAWQVLDREYGRPLLEYLMHRELDEFSAQEIIQEVYIHLFEKVFAGNLRFNNSYELLTNMRKTALNVWRDKQLTKRFSADNAGDLSVLEQQQVCFSDLLADRMIISDELIELYLNAIKEFIAGVRKSNHQEVIQLHFIDCLTPREISDKTGQQHETVKKIITRKRKQLVAYLEEVMRPHLVPEP